ncbi:MAG TPA: YfiR family protein [Myxococcota bacterium]|nr:YfiR family protein [Myxococcota bacterium]
MKARFVFLLFKYVTWPESAVPANAPFVVGVVGDPAFADAFKRIVAESPSQGHPIDVRTLADGAEATGIHLLYVGGEDPAALRKLAHDYHGEPVLTVADRFEFPDLGGDIGLEMSGDRVTFSISRRKSERGDFVISSKLMRLASEVK